jgi:hypothetical protein
MKNNFQHTPDHQPNLNNEVKKDIPLKEDKKKKIPFSPTRLFRRGFIPKIAIQLTCGLMSLLFGLKPKLVKRFIYWSINLRKKSGVVFYIKYIKQTRLHITRYICSQPLYSNDVGVSLDKFGFPSRLDYLKEYIDNNDLRKIRGVLSLLYFSRCILPSKEESKKIKPKFNVITDEYTGKNFEIPDEFIRSFVKKFKLKKELPKWSMLNHYISGKASPVGKATLNAGLALYLTSKRDKHNWLLTHFSDVYGIMDYMTIIGSNLTRIWRNPGMVLKLSLWCPIHGVSGEIGKLSIVEDPELKLRIIAMVDYYSQFFLRPIHDQLLGLLKHFNSDRTFTQDPTHNWKPKGNKFWSLDLSSATDRFPVNIQQKLLSFIYDKEFASIWKSVLVDRDYSYEVEEGDESKFISVKYKVGQPMGAYSSWAAFTLTHHLIVHYAAHLCGLKNFKAYILLGDDIVINNDKVACKYKAIMARIGVDISELKSHVSWNTYEFAKRWFKKKIEISPFPLKGILHNYHNIPVVLLQIMTYVKRCSNINFNGNSLELISKLYHKKIINKKFYSYKNLYNRLEAWFLLYKYSFGTISNWELRRFLVINNLPEWICNIKEELIPSVMKELLHSGLITIAERSSVGINDMFEDLKKFIKSQIEIFPELKKDFSVTEFRDMPLIHALLNRLREIKNSLEEIMNDPSYNLIEAMNLMRIEKVSKIVSEKRDLVETVNGLNNLWKSSIRNAKKITEENYYIYELTNLSTVLSNGRIMLSSEPLKDFIKTSTPTIDLLSNLSKGHYFETDLGPLPLPDSIQVPPLQDS